MLLNLDVRERGEDFTDRFKLALVSADPQAYVETVFPRDDDGALTDVTPGGPVDEWDLDGPLDLDFSQSDTTKEEAMAIVSGAIGEISSTFSMAELGEIKESAGSGGNGDRAHKIGDKEVTEEDLFGDDI